MHTNLLYIGPLRPETLALLEALPPAEHALFVTPTHNAPEWEEVLGLFPQAQQQVAKVAEASGEQPYYEFNLPEFNASQHASGLYTLYPGLELLESSPQPLLGVEALLEELYGTTANIIVVEQPELVWPLLKALVALPAYKQLRDLWIRVGAVPLYEGMPEAEEIHNWCQEQGFELQVTSDDDPDLPLLQLTRHPYYDRWQEQAQRAAKLNKQLKSAQLKNEEQQALEQAYEQLQVQYAEQEKQLKALQEKFDQQQSLQTAVAELQKTMNQKFDEQHVFMKEAANALGQHVTRCTMDE